MRWIKANIKIKLMSDLCVSSGLAYAGIIDADSCINANGFPYIPAKRLKGIMREAAEMIGYSEECICRMFGEGGSGFDDISSETLYLGDAVLLQTRIVDSEISELKKSNDRETLSQQNIMKLFSHIKAQTRLDENGVADNNTLRYTRVINQYMPKCLDPDQHPLEFVASVEYCENMDKELRNILFAVRHIGMNRNRGLGNIKCELDTEGSEIVEDHETKHEIVLNQADKYVRIRYTLTNKSPLIMSSTRDDVTDDYISGRAMLGALAGIYLKLNRNTSVDTDDTFKELFLSGETIFSNLYITDEINGREYIPAPLFLNRLKKSKRYVCVAVKDDKDTARDYRSENEENSNGDYRSENGNQPKKLNGKYVCYELNSQPNKIHLLEPMRDLVYHHSKKQTYDPGRMGEDINDGILYSSEVLEQNQHFSGSIIVKEKYESIVRALLGSHLVRLGKSRSSQYGRCEIAIKETSEEYKRPCYKLAKDEAVLVVFESDTIIPGKHGYTTAYEEVQKYIEEATRIDPQKETGLQPIKSEESTDVYMSSKVTAGYNSKINLKRASVPAIRGGSAFLLKAPVEGVYYLDHIGSFVSEGFGKARIMKLDNLSYRVHDVTSDALQHNVKSIEKSEKVRAIELEIRREEKLEQLKRDFIEKLSDVDLNVSASLIGRVTLMLKESVSDEKDPLHNFAERICSIKRDKEREEIVEKLKTWKVCVITFKKDERDGRRIVDDVKNCTCNEEDGADFYSEIWYEYLFFILTHIKYKMSNAKRS